MRALSYIAAAALLAVSASASAALVNGGFEGLAGDYMLVAGAGNTAISGWETTQNGVEWFAPSGYGWTAYEGADSIDLAYYTTAGGGIRQTFSVLPNQEYAISFAIGSIVAFGRDGTTGDVNVIADGNSIGTVSLGTVSTSDISWVPVSFNATSTGGTMTIELTNFADPFTHFAFIDAVAATPVPEPGILGLLLGAGLMLARRTR